MESDSIQNHEIRSIERLDQSETKNLIIEFDRMDNDHRSARGTLQIINMLMCIHLISPCSTLATQNSKMTFKLHENLQQTL